MPRPKTKDSLSEEVEQIDVRRFLVETKLGLHPVVYDKQHPDYLNMNTKQNAWKQICQNIGMNTNNSCNWK